MGEKVNSRLEELTSKARQVTAELLAACHKSSNACKLAAAVGEAQEVEACFSAYLADLKHWIRQPEKEGTCSFKIHNVPQWPAARLKAWLVRNKLAVKELEKEPSWTHAILTVPKDCADALQKSLSTKAIQGKTLQVRAITAESMQSHLLPFSRPPPGPPPAGGKEKEHSAELPAHSQEHAAEPAPEPPHEDATPSQEQPTLMIGAVDQSESPCEDCAEDPLEPSAAPQDEPEGLIKPQEGKSVDIRDALSPLWQLPYSEQLKLKQEQCYDALCRLTSELAMCITQTRKPDWLQKAIEAQDQRGSAACCPVQNILRSPATHAYRNKADFSIGFDMDHKPRAGHFFGLFRNGWSEVGPVDDILQLSSTAKGYAALMTRFLRSDKCNLPAWNKDAKRTDTAAVRGFWRSLTIREGRQTVWFPPLGPEQAISSREGDITWQSLQVEQYRVGFVRAEAPPSAHASFRWQLPADVAATCNAQQPEAPTADELVVSVMVNMTFGDGDEAAAHGELKAWAKFVETERPVGLPAPTSMCFQHSEILGNGAPPSEPVKVLPGWSGSAVGHHVSMCGTQFSVHPLAFFQVNTAAATLVYKLVQSLALPEPGAPQGSKCILDICCGTGTMGIIMAPYAAHIVGIDNNAQNIESARANAVANGVENISFVHGTAEKMIDAVLQKDKVVKASEVVAVVDPPRGGLHTTVLYAILGCEHIRRLIYVSCNPDSLIADLRILLTPAKAARRAHVAPNKGVSKRNAPHRYAHFRPVTACPVDMFPHTNHVELVMLLERE